MSHLNLKQIRLLKILKQIVKFSEDKSIVDHKNKLSEQVKIFWDVITQ